jgi:hypothetical protein
MFQHCNSVPEVLWLPPLTHKARLGRDRPDRPLGQALQRAMQLDAGKRKA